MMQVMDLAGTWQARWHDGWRGGAPHLAEKPDTDARRWMPVQVPGEIHLDLLRAGIISDPDVGLGVLQARWVEECWWSFRHVLTAPDVPAGARVWLVCERLELVGRLVLNGVEIGTHANAFVPCRIDITGRLRPGENILLVHLESGLFSVSEKPAEGYLGFQDQRLHKRHWLRTTQSQFGWDWAPRLLNIGITAPVRIEWTTDPVRLERVIPLVSVDAELTRGEVRVRAVIEGLAEASVDIELEAALPGCGAHERVVVGVRPGIGVYELVLSVEKPRLWWPVGCGEPTLHELVVSLNAPGMRLEGRQNIGFRRARFLQEPMAAGGLSYILEVNNRKVFAKGANLVPADIIRARIDRARYVGLVARAIEANMNLLRVWGGGLYEADEFYELCDQQGILVWQEFIFACGRYPGIDQTFYDSVRAEATHQIRRLAGHPSLVVWCGNNENEWGAWDWGFDRGMVLPDHAIPHHLLPRLLAQEDPGRHYQPSSPWSPSGHPNRDDAGDQHPWATTMADGEFRAFRAMTCRFPNEGGMLGPASLATVRACLAGGPAVVGSPAFRLHDNATESWHEPQGIDAAFTAWLGFDPQAMRIEDWVYYAGLLQGEGLREYCDNFRRRMFSSAAAVFWMFNDTWPTTRSWTIVDHRLRRTPAFHPVRRSLAPIAVVVAQQGDEVIVVGVNDTDLPVAGELRFGIFRISGGLPLDERACVQLPPNAATILTRFPQALWKNPCSEIAFAQLEQGSQVVARNRLILPRFRELAWVDAAPVVTLEQGVATFTSSTFAWGVCLDLDGEMAVADNFFDCWPEIPVRMAWAGTQPPRILHIGNLGPIPDGPCAPDAPARGRV